MNILFLKFALFLYPVSLICSESKEQLFYDAVRMEATDEIAQAITLYEKASQEAVSTKMLGNLANLYYKSENYGRSILNYRKALVLDENNRDILSSLAYVRKVAELPPLKAPDTGYLTGETNNSWKIILATFFWIGLLIITYLFFIRNLKKHTFFFLGGWIVGNLILAFLINTSGKNKRLTELEVIALKPKLSIETNASNTIQLRRFAAASSNANTTVKEGQSLLIEESSIGRINAHTGQNSGKWLLVRTPDARKKGWVMADEVGWVIDN